MEPSGFGKVYLEFEKLFLNSDRKKLHFDVAKEIVENSRNMEWCILLMLDALVTKFNDSSRFMLVSARRKVNQHKMLVEAVVSVCEDETRLREILDNQPSSPWSSFVELERAVLKIGGEKTQNIILAARSVNVPLPDIIVNAVLRVWRSSTMGPASEVGNISHKQTQGRKSGDEGKLPPNQRKGSPDDFTLSSDDIDSLAMLCGYDSEDLEEERIKAASLAVVDKHQRVLPDALDDAAVVATRSSTDHASHHQQSLPTTSPLSSTLTNSQHQLLLSTRLKRLEERMERVEGLMNQILFSLEPPVSWGTGDANDDGGEDINAAGLECNDMKSNSSIFMHVSLCSDLYSHHPHSPTCSGGGSSNSSSDGLGVSASKRPRMGRDRAYWARLRSGLHKGQWCAPGMVVGFFHDGVGLPTSEAIMIGVCAAQPDTLGALPVDAIDSLSSSSSSSTVVAHSDEEAMAFFVAVAVVGEVPVLLSHQRDVDRFRDGDRNEFLSVGEDGAVGLWDARAELTSGHVFALALRGSTSFDEQGRLRPFQGVRAVRALVSHQVEAAALRGLQRVLASRVGHLEASLQRRDEEQCQLLHGLALQLEEQARRIQVLERREGPPDRQSPLPVQAVAIAHSGLGDGRNVDLVDEQADDSSRLSGPTISTLYDGKRGEVETIVTAVAAVPVAVAVAEVVEDYDDNDDQNHSHLPNALNASQEDTEMSDLELALMLQAQFDQESREYAQQRQQQQQQQHERQAPQRDRGLGGAYAQAREPLVNVEPARDRFGGSTSTPGLRAQPPARLPALAKGSRVSPNGDGKQSQGVQNSRLAASTKVSPRPGTRSLGGRQLALQPCASHASKQNFCSTIATPCSLADLIDVLGEAERQRANIIESDALQLWGICPGNSARQYCKLEVGDLVVFCADRRGFFAASVRAKIDNNPALAEKLWGVDENGRTWQHVYAVADGRYIDLPVEELNAALGYKPNNVVQGFTVVAHPRAVAAIDLLEQARAVSGEEERIKAEALVGLRRRRVDRSKMANKPPFGHIS